MFILLQVLTVILIVSWVLEKDTGSVISNHMVFNIRLGVVVTWAWTITAIIFIFE